ncbi:unnamed protein product, partial [Closterium sp. NIES-54]
ETATVRSSTKSTLPSANSTYTRRKPTGVMAGASRSTGEEEEGDWEEGVVVEEAEKEEEKEKEEEEEEEDV